MIGILHIVCTDIRRSKNKYRCHSSFKLIGERKSVVLRSILSFSYSLGKTFMRRNILLTRDLRAKIADVGVAHVISNDPDSQLMLGNQHSAPRSPSSSSDDARHSIVTGTDIAVDSINSNAGFVGTFSWAAPELLLGGKVTTKTDMYSFGVVLFEIVTGEVPVRGHIHLPDAPACCPQEVVDLMSACMSIQPEGRPTAKEAYGILERCPPHDT